LERIYIKYKRVSVLLSLLFAASLCLRCLLSVRCRLVRSIFVEITNYIELSEGICVMFSVQKTNTALQSFGAYASRKLGDIRYGNQAANF
jgi:hypothetical protein